MDVYLALKVNNIKKLISEQKYAEMHEEYRSDMAKLLGEVLEMVESISPEEYEEATNDDDDREAVNLNEFNGVFKVPDDDLHDWDKYEPTTTTTTTTTTSITTSITDDEREGN